MAKTKTENFLLRFLVFTLILTRNFRLSECKHVGVIQEYLSDMASNNESHLQLPPTDNPDQVYVVNISVYMQDVFDFNEQDFSFTPCFWLEQKWVDTRLKYHPFKQNNKWVDMIMVPNHIAKERGKKALHFTNQEHAICSIVVALIYDPMFTNFSVFLWNTFFFNAKDTQSSASSLGISDTQIIVYPDGRIAFSRYFGIKIKCHFDFHSFPHDVQICWIKFGSFSHGLGTVRFGNLELYFEGDRLESPSFSFVEHRIYEERRKRNESMCVVEFKLQRQLQYFIYQVENLLHFSFLCCL